MNLISLMIKLNIQNFTSPKQHSQNDEALIVVDCSNTDIEKMIEQESHTRIKLTHQEISTKLLVCKLKIKMQKIFESYVFIYIYQLFAITTIEFRKKRAKSRKIFRVKIDTTHKLLRMQSDKFKSKRDV